MNNENRFCPLPGCFFVLICPATVISHCVALKKLWIFRSETRVVYQHYNGFSFYIQAGVIIPIVLWGINAITHKNYVTICK